MIIDGLPVMSSPQSGDEIPIERGTATYKIDYDALAAAIISKLGDPVGVSHGGSGLAVSPSLLVNLASANADTIMKQSPRPGVYGTLPVANGGTGQTTLQALRNAMGLGDTTGVLPVANGGTGLSSLAISTFQAQLATGASSNYNSGLYDPLTKRVRFMLDWSTSTPVGSSVALATIPAAYKPASTITGVLLRVNGTVVSLIGSCGILTSGAVIQGASGNCTSAQMIFEYYL